MPEKIDFHFVEFRKLNSKKKLIGKNAANSDFLLVSVISNGTPFIKHVSLALVRLFYLIPFLAPHLVFFSYFTHFVLCLCFVFDLTLILFFFSCFFPLFPFPFYLFVLYSAYWFFQVKSLLRSTASILNSAEDRRITAMSYR